MKKYFDSNDKEIKNGDPMIFNCDCGISDFGFAFELNGEFSIFMITGKWYKIDDLENKEMYVVDIDTASDKNALLKIKEKIRVEYLPGFENED